jgi:hypothetical protein
MKTWRPDTCECWVEEIYNGAEIIGMGQILKKCTVHQDVLDEELYGVLYTNPDSENKMKNKIHSILLGQDSIKDLGLHKKIIKDGQETSELNDGVEYAWSFSGVGKDRKLEVEIKGATLTKAQKKSIKDLGDEKFGVGKVKVL